MSRPLIGALPMTPAQRQQRRRDKVRAARQADTGIPVTDPVATTAPPPPAAPTPPIAVARAPSVSAETATLAALTLHRLWR